jgi:hypothetical protein
VALNSQIVAEWWKTDSLARISRDKVYSISATIFRLDHHLTSFGAVTRWNHSSAGSDLAQWLVPGDTDATGLRKQPIPVAAMDECPIILIGSSAMSPRAVRGSDAIQATTVVEYLIRGGRAYAPICPAVGWTTGTKHQLAADRGAAVLGILIGTPLANSTPGRVGGGSHDQDAVRLWRKLDDFPGLQHEPEQRR